MNYMCRCGGWMIYQASLGDWRCSTCGRIGVHHTWKGWQS